MESYRWEDHSRHLTNFVAKLYRNMEVTDCVLDTKGGVIKAHRVILAACSPYFKNLLVDYDSTERIPLKEIKYTDMRNFLDFIYNGEVNVPAANVRSFMKTVKFFQVDSLFTENVSCSNTCKIRLSESSMQPYAAGEYYINHGVARESERKDGMTVDYRSTELQTTLKSSMIVKDILDEGEKNLQDYLSPISFVAVPSFSEKVEEHDDKSVVCSGGVLKNPLEEYSYDSDLIKEGIVKRDNDMKIEPNLQMCYKEEMNVCELLYPNKEDTSISEAQNMNFGFDILSFDKVLCDESSQNLEGKSVVPTQQSCGIKANQNVTLDKMGSICYSENSFVERSTDLEVEFEAICDISENDIKKEKFSGDLTPESTPELNNTSLVVIEPRGKQLPVDTTIVNVFKEVADVTASPSRAIERVKEKKKGPNILLQSANSTQVQDSNENAAVHRSAFTQIKLHKVRKQLIKRTGSKSSHIASLNMKKQCNNQHLVPRDSFHFNPSGLRGGHALTENVQTNSTNRKNYSCTYCRKSFDQVSHLTIHLQTHTRIILFPCKMCKKTFIQYDALMNHMRTHPEAGPFHCEICKKLFTHKDHLEEHQLKHNTKKLFYCEICESSFDQDSSFKKHMQIHPGKETFQCEICEKSFVADDHFPEYWHAHTREKPLCEICQFSISGNDALRKHMRTYSRKKPFLCEICAKSFWGKSCLEDHLNTHLLGIVPL